MKLGPHVPKQMACQQYSESLLKTFSLLGIQCHACCRRASTARHEIFPCAGTCEATVSVSEYFARDVPPTPGDAEHAAHHACMVTLMTKGGHSAEEARRVADDVCGLFPRSADPRTEFASASAHGKCASAHRWREVRPHCVLAGSDLPSTLASADTQTDNVARFPRPTDFGMPVDEAFQEKAGHTWRPTLAVQGGADDTEECVVSLHTGARKSKSLREEGHDVERITTDLDGSSEGADPSKVTGVRASGMRAFCKAHCFQCKDLTGYILGSWS